MRVAILSESTGNPSGFGQQTRLLSKGLSDKGHEVVVLATAAFENQPDPPEGVTQWPVRLDDLPSIDKAVERARPDAIIVFWTTFHLALYSKLRCVSNAPMFFWLPWEASSLTKELAAAFDGIPDNHVVALSEFGLRLWSPYITSDAVIPHGLDLDVFNYDESFFTPESRLSLRRNWSHNLRRTMRSEDLVILNLDRNIWHKRWDLTYDIVRRLVKDFGESKNVHLIAHTQVKTANTDAFSRGFDLFELEKLYGIAGSVCYTGFDWDAQLTPEDLVELYRLSDVRLSTSGGEGFGIPTIEAQAVGCLQVVPYSTTMPELLGDRHPSLVVPSSIISDPREDQTVLWQCPDASGMARKVREMSELPEADKKLWREAGAHRVKTKYSKENMVDLWDDFLKSHVSEDYSWHEHRWGYTRRNVETLSWASLGKTIHSVVGSSYQGGRVLVLGSFDGKQVDTLLRTGLDVAGIEPDAEACSLMSSQAKLCVENQPFDSDWPSASIAVVTDCFDLIDADGSLDAVVEKLATHEWVFARLGSSSKWGTPSLDSVRVENLLESVGLTRRTDLEEMSKESGDLMTHQIWQKSSDTSFMPSGILGEKSNESERGGLSGAHEVAAQRPVELERISPT